MAELKIGAAGAVFALLDPAEVTARAGVLRAGVDRLRGGEGAALAEVLPGQGLGDAAPLDVAAVTEIVGADPRAVDSSGEPLRANVARLRSTLKRWARRPPAGGASSPAGVPSVAPEPPGFRELLAGAMRDYFGDKAAELGPASLTDDALILLTEDPSWAVGALQGAWTGVLAEHLRRQR